MKGLDQGAISLGEITQKEEEDEEEDEEGGLLEDRVSVKDSLSSG